MREWNNKHLRTFKFAMPRIRTMKSKKPPQGWDAVEPTLTELLQKIRQSKPQD